MEVALLPSDLRPGVTTHQELDPTNMLSLIASLTPFSDYNQSPRNMYQCQMGKQTMGTPVTSYPHRVDNKMYRILTPQVHHSGPDPLAHEGHWTHSHAEKLAFVCGCMDRRLLCRPVGIGSTPWTSSRRYGDNDTSPMPTAIPGLQIERGMWNG